MSRIVKQADVRRQELLDIGIQLYFEAGEKGVSIQQVVKQANVAIGLFYYYFKTKDDFLHEALNNYIDKEIQAIEGLLKSDMPASNKLNIVLDAYFEYVKKMAPYRFSKAFHSETHYALTRTLTQRLKKEVSNVLAQGVTENVFQIKNIELIAGFIVSGLCDLFDSDEELTDSSLDEVKHMILKILKRSES